MADQTAEAEQRTEEVEEHLAVFVAGDATIHQRLAVIIGALPAIGKTSWNEQQRFHYRSHDDVLNALNPLLASCGVVVVPDVVERIPGERTTSGGKTMYEVNLHVRFAFYGAAGDSVVASAWGEGTDMGDKATNKAMTAAFKAVLAQVFAVSTAETLDMDGTGPEHTTRGAVSRSPGQRAAAPTGSPPDTALLPNALRDADAIARQLAEFDQSIDWQETLRAPLRFTFGVETRAEVPQERSTEFWTRLGNLEARMREGMKGGDFPPLSDDEIATQLRWAFSLPAEAPVEVIYRLPADEAEAAEQALQAAAADDDVPFGDDATTTQEEEAK